MMQCNVDCLNMVDCGLTADHLRAFEESIETKKFSELVLFGNRTLGVEGLSSVSRITEKCKVNSLNVGNCKLTSENLMALKESLRDHQVELVKLGRMYRYVKCLYEAEDKRETHEEIEAILSLLPCITKELSLSRWHIETKDRLRLQAALAQNPEVTIVFDEHGWNFITKDENSDPEEKQEIQKEEEENLYETDSEKMTETEKEEKEQDTGEDLCFPPERQQALEGQVEQHTDVSPAFTIKVISPEGGEITIDDCSISFPSEAVNKVTRISARVYVPTKDKPETTLPGHVDITPTVECKPRGTNFLKPITFRVPTWVKSFYTSRYDHQVVAKVLCGKTQSNGDVVWDTIDTVEIGREDYIEYTCSHFCKFKACIEGCEIVYYGFDYFLCCDNDNNFTVVVCLSSEALCNRLFREYSSSVHEVKIKPSDHISVRENDKLEIKMVCETPGFTFAPNDEEEMTVDEAFCQLDKYRTFDFVLEREVDDVTSPRVEINLQINGRTARLTQFQVSWRDQHRGDSYTDEDDTSEESFHYQDDTSTDDTTSSHEEDRHESGLRAGNDHNLDEGEETEISVEDEATGQGDHLSPPSKRRRINGQWNNDVCPFDASSTTGTPTVVSNGQESSDLQNISGREQAGVGCGITIPPDDVEMMRKEKRKSVSTHKKSQRLSNEGDGTRTLSGQIREGMEPQLGNPPPANNSSVCMQDINNRRRSLQQCLELRDCVEILANSGFFLNQNKFIECCSCSSQWTIDQALSQPSQHSLHNTNCRYSSSHSVEQPQDIRQVASDSPAIISDDIGDPPGQQSVYIPSGDTRSETYRLSTFERFPSASAANIPNLAKDGFYYTGYYDRVKCFACARSVERFEARDNVVKREWHKPNCPLAKGEPCGNIPKLGLFHHLFSNPAARPGTSQQQENVLQQRDPVTGAVVRTVRYPADLPERVRRSGGVFEIGPNNSVVIQSGPGHQSNPPIRIGTESAPPRQWRLANIVSGDHRRFVLNLFLNRELDRLTSFARWPSTRPNISPAALARSGFFYLGDLDRTQCFSCGGVLRNWTLEDDADEEHRTHFPACPMILRTERRNVPIPELPESSQERQTNYPCLYPANPHMRSEANRLGTFDHRWPTGRIRATPAQIAVAGFFYLGERDRVKCWYCNGGLQNWERDDVPWDEHAKWFPNCQFVLQNKGQIFVFRHLALNPHLARPIIARQEGSPIGAQAGAPQPARSLDIPPSGTTLRQPEAPPVIVDPQVEMRKRNERIEEIMKNSEIVKMVLTMGFSENLVKLVLEDKIGAENSSGNIYESVSALLDDVMKKEVELAQEEEHEEEDEQPGCSYPRPSNRGSFPSVFSSQTSGPVSTLGSAAGSGMFNVSMFQDEDEDMETGDLYSTSAHAQGGPASAPAPGENPASLKKILDQIEEERMCKVCFSNEADMVFIPCSHMCCCMECTQALRQCPVCRVKIEKAIKTYTK